jgi:hypothetical protein
MRVLVIHETYWGNTAQVAEAVAGALLPAHQVRMLAAAEVDDLALRATDLVVIGAPTHVHGLPSHGSRAMAVKQGRMPADHAPTSGVRELLERMQRADGTAAAAFDTRVPGVRFFTGSAGRLIARSLRKHGYRCVVPAESFIVQGKTPALLDGELDRARAWARAVLEAATQAQGQARPTPMAAPPRPL